MVRAPKLFAAAADRRCIASMVARATSSEPCLQATASALFPPRRGRDRILAARCDGTSPARAREIHQARRARRRGHRAHRNLEPQAQRRRDGVSRQVARFFRGYDVWLSPTLAEPPLPLGSFDPTPANPIQGIFRAAQFVPLTPIFNVTGQPAMSVPLSWNHDNVPIGVQFAARFGDEATLFRLAAQLEQACPWADRWPAF